MEISVGENRKPLISVIVPVYNGENYLENCIKSIESQTYSDLEIIIVNDGSTDRTGEICQQLKEQNSNVHVISLADEGVSTARNKGMELAKGEYISFVDADDRIHPKALELLFQNLKDTDSDICGCGFYMWQREEEWQEHLQKQISIDKKKSYSPKEYLKEELLQGNSRCWSKLYKQSLIEKCRFRKELSIGEDMFFLMELLEHAQKITEISYPGYGYYQNAKGAMNRAFTPRYMEQITCWEMAREKVMQMAPELSDKVTSILITAIMLTAGKLAFLPGKERKQQEEYIGICSSKLKKEITEKGAFGMLSKGYRIKAIMFAKVPNLYLFLYHLRKYVA